MSMQEVEIHRMLRHPFIIPLLWFFPNNDKLWIIMPRAQQSLKQYLQMRKILSEAEAKLYTEQLVKALLYLKHKKVIHRDLKPQNILLSGQGGSIAQICDYGLAAKLQEGRKLYGKCGTIPYYSPEMVCNQSYDYSTDMWALAVIVYEMVVGENPFLDSSPIRVFEKIKNLSIKYPKQLSTSLTALLKKMFQRNPVNRIKIEDVLKEEFFIDRRASDIASVGPSKKEVPPNKKLEIALESAGVSFTESQRKPSSVLKESKEDPVNKLCIVSSESEDFIVISSATRTHNESQCDMHGPQSEKNFKSNEI